MAELAIHPEISADRRGDRNGMLVVTAMIAISFVVSSLSAHADLLRIRSDVSWRHAWLNEGSSHLAILIAAMIIPKAIDRAPLSAGVKLLHAISAHIAGIFVFSLAHITMMFGSRYALFPLFIGYPYDLNIFSISNILYEFRKDIFTYLLIAFGFYVLREVEHRRLEARAALNKAREEGSLTLNSGGTLLQTSASEIAYASAAGNYVDVCLKDGPPFFARMTLARLERLLAEASGDHIRIHRSHIVSRSFIRRAKTDGEGGLEVELRDGCLLPCSRSRRADVTRALEAAVGPSANMAERS